MNVACSTCLDSLTLESGISATPCGHVFHTDCITKWIESGQNNCSQCRAECQKKNIVKLFFSQNELGLQQNEVIDDISEENQKLLKQANEAKSCELEASRKVEKIQKEKFELKALIKTHKNIEQKFVIDKQDMLEQIENLKKEVTDLKSKLHKSTITDEFLEENQKLLKQANDAKSQELEASRKVEKIQKEKFELKALIKTHKNIELNVKRNFNIDKQGMLEQIEELNKEVTDLKSLIKTHKDRALNIVRNFNIDRHDMLEKIEKLKSFVKTHKDEELNVKRNFNIDKQDMLKQIEELKKEVNDLKLELKLLIKTHKNEEFNSKISFDVDKHYMLEQIEELKKEATDLKSKLHKSIVTLEVGLLNPGQSQQQPITTFRGDPTRKIWQGELSWVAPYYDSNQEQVAFSVFCTVSTQVMESSQQPTVCSDTWPKRLIMQMIPKSLVQQIGGRSSKYFQNARSVLFDLANNPAKNSLMKVLNQGYAGLVHFHSDEDEKCDIRVLVLLFSPADNHYLGYIPSKQIQFVDCIRKVILEQQELQRVAAASGHRVPAGSQGQPQQSGGSVLSNLQSNHQQQH